MHDEHVLDDQLESVLIVDFIEDIFQFSLNYSCLLGIEKAWNLEYTNLNEFHQVMALGIILINVQELDENF